MSETTSSPRDRDEDEEQGSFVGGEFGHGDNTEDGHLTSAQQAEAEREREAHLADPDQSAAITQETVVDPLGESTLASASAGPDGSGGLGGDVEGIGTEPAPGDRNEPL
ncbi:hypothetical protein [Ornithinimicrobium pratense]|uniref:Uncharacterized protein n=1 Tax=Ornithinimicrobium pratense TaxID=2593973 RepID=A0A5J6V2T1_9MICO|nr:hypothetical protein [Ornithinimicrobium pratense]QFG68035.1 hypothetical protein FY030_04255 [Ornithinimicrobium pratense]